MFATQQNQPTGGATNPAQQPKPSQRRPPAIHVYQNVPLDKRLHPSITPDDPKWKEMLAYFNHLVSTPGLNIGQILKDHFTEHEIMKFLPTDIEPYLQWQKDDIPLFKRTLETRFKGVLPTLGMKITMLYFGLPVAPMKLGRNQYVTTSDLIDTQEEVTIDRDPLAFLDCYKERTYGLPPTEITSIPIGTSSHKSDADSIMSLGLRGGMLEDDELEMIASESQCDEDMDLQPHEGTAMELSLRGGSSSVTSYTLYGRQGHVDVVEGYEALATAVTRLLSLMDRAEIAVFTIMSTNNGRIDITATLKAPITIPAAGEEGALSKVLGHIEAAGNPKVFVRLAMDKASVTFEPQPLDGGVARIFITDEEDLEWVAYLRTPSRPNLNHSIVQYASGYQHTIQAVVGDYHQYVTFPEISGPAGPVSVYSCEDLPQKLVSDIATNTYCNIKASITPIDPNTVPVIVPDSQSHHSSNAIELPMQALADLKGLNRVVDHALSRQPSRVKSATGIQIYAPADDFQNMNASPLYIKLVDGKATESAMNLWSERFGTLRSQDPSQSFAIIAQPWFETYVMSLPQSLQSTQDFDPVDIRLHECNLDLFRLKVSTSLYPNHYNPQDKEHTIIIEDSIRSYRHVITYNSTEQDWQRILRRIGSRRLEITLKKEDQDAKWDVDVNSYWGPSYSRWPHDYIPPGDPAEKVGNATNHLATIDYSAKSGRPRSQRLMKSDTGMSSYGDSAGSNTTFGTSRSQEIANSLYKTYSTRLSDFMAMQGSDNSMRDLTVWDTPSIFTNPLKPVMPLHAPCLESIIRTGPDVPAITLGMRTATETARLEREVHTLRAQLLDRIRECPYNDCEKRFSYMDTHGFEKHIKLEHKILQCALCIAFQPSDGHDIDIDQSLMYMDREQILYHIASEHADHLRTFVKVPKGGGGKVWETATPQQKKKVNLTVFPYCIHCGRHEVQCDDQEDMFHHHINCRGSDAASRETLQAAPFCKTCGKKAARNTYGQLKCSDASCSSYDVNLPPKHDCCQKCGFNMSGCSLAYRAKHERLCKDLPGGPWNGNMMYCAFCGIYVADLDAAEQEQHVWLCPARPQPQPRECPACVRQPGVAAPLLYTPQEVQKHLEAAHGSSARCPWCEHHLIGENTKLDWSDGAKHYHFAHHMGQVSPRTQAEGEHPVPGSRCPYYQECGVNTTDMNSDQWSRHMENDHDAHPFFPNGMPDSGSSAPPLGYDRSTQANSSLGSRGASTTASGGAKKRPHPPGVAPTSTQYTDTEDDDSAAGSKRRKFSTEEDPTYANPHGPNVEPEEEYMDTRADSDQGQDLSPLKTASKAPGQKHASHPPTRDPFKWAPPPHVATATTTAAAAGGRNGKNNKIGYPWFPQDLPDPNEDPAKQNAPTMPFATPTTTTAATDASSTTQEFPRQVGIPHIASVTPAKMHQQQQHEKQQAALHTTTTPLLITEAGEQQPQQEQATATTRSGRPVRASAAKKASEAQAPARTPGRRGQTPAKTTAATRRAQPVQVEEVEEQETEPALPVPRAASRAASPAKRGRPRK